MTIGDWIYNMQSFFSLQRSAAAKAPGRRISNPVFDPPFGGEYALYPGWAEEKQARMAMQTSWTYSAMYEIAKAALPADLAVKIAKGEELQDAPNHPLELLWRMPNPELSREYVMMHTVYSILLKSSFWFLYPDSRGNVAEIWPMPFSKVRPVPSDLADDGLISHYIYMPNAKREIAVPKNNVVWLRFPDPLDLYGELPPLRAAMRPAALDNAQSRWNLNHFDVNRGLPTSIVSVPETLPDDLFAEVKRELKAHHGENMTVRSGTIKVDFMQETHQEMEFLQGRNFNREEIYRVMGVPLDVTDKEAWRWMVNNTVWPLLSMIAGQITTQVSRPLFGDNVLVEFEDIRPQDRSLAVQESVQYAPFRSMNQERATRGEPPLPVVKIPAEVPGFGGMSLYDDVPVKLIYTVARELVGYRPGPDPQPVQTDGNSGNDGFSGQPSLPGSAGATHTQQQEESEALGYDVSDVMQLEATRRDALERWQRISLNRLHNGKKAVYWYDSNGALDEAYVVNMVGLCRSEPEIKNVFAELINGTEPDYQAIKAPGDQTPQIQLDLEAAVNDPLRQFLMTQASRIYNEIIVAGKVMPGAEFWAGETNLLTEFMTPYVEDWAEKGIGEAVVAVTGLGIGVDANVNARAAEWAGKYSLELAKGLTATTKELTKAKLKNWIQSGKPFPELEKALAEYIAPQWRARLIAATEVTRAFAEAAHQIAQEVDVIKEEIWNTAKDERVCPICGPLNGERKPVNGTFTGGLSSPPAHPNCRCWMSYGI